MKLHDNYEWKTLLDKHFNEYHIAPFTPGASGAEIFLISDNGNTQYILKSHGAGLQTEYLNYVWLQGKVPVPQVRFFATTNKTELLCMTALTGKTLEQQIGQVAAEEIVRSYARSLRQLHSLAIDDGAVVRRLDERLKAAGDNIRNNRVDTAQMQPENRHSSPTELFEQLLRLYPAKHELVFTHGDYCLDNIIYNEGVLSGFIDLGNGGVADKYQDIALAARNISDAWNEQMTFLFYEEYGLDTIDHDKMIFYRLLDEFF